ncbi:MAG: RNA polymerase sigma factor [Anaerobutyricum sp.]|nr:RNA polymerase sigma factor [Anaerobutyricum sp.]
MEKEEVFDSLYEQYKDTAMRTAFFICKNMPDSEDVVQETFVKCYLHFDELKDKKDFKPWMLKILIRSAYHLLKKEKREMPEEQVEDRMKEKTVAGPADRFLEKEEAERILSLINQLPEKQRIVVILYYYNELSVKEIASVTRSMEGTVKSRLYLARKQLRKMMESGGGREVFYEV